MGIINMDFDTTDQILFIYSAFVTYLGKKWEYNEAVRREALYIFIESGIPTKLVRLIKMCLNETYSRVQVGKHLSD